MSCGPTKQSCNQGAVAQTILFTCLVALPHVHLKHSLISQYALALSLPNGTSLRHTIIEQTLFVQHE